jgi:hypothetical protein
MTRTMVSDGKNYLIVAILKYSNAMLLWNTFNRIA